MPISRSVSCCFFVTALQCELFSHRLIQHQRYAAIRFVAGLIADILLITVAHTINRQNGSTFAKMTGLLEPWEEMAQKYRNGEISREEYDQWRYRYPRSEAERNEAARRALKESE